MINSKFANKKKIFRKYKKCELGDDKEIINLKEKYCVIPEIIKTFDDLPLSWKTQKGLKGANYKYPTDIQKESILYSLKGRDVMGSAITGSGKTLAFLIPVLENLFMDKWSRPDGVGALIISPTRELAYQIFQTLKKIGIHHDISAGLIIGGKNLKFEKNRMDQCNIIICTPGRILQHMDENPLFNISTMRILVLDEADRCLDMGFEKTMNAILENLPTDRQTIIFSATQTKSVEDLGRLNLKNPVYVAPHEQQFIVPISLQQNYVVVNLEDKITMMWSFIKNHLKQKIIVFLSSCKQVKFIYEIFKKMRPGTSLLALYGSLHQDRRVDVYDQFCRKSNVVLFATDIASRGLDFPTVNWVIQLDCPEDVNQYIHRSGRTARNNAKGESLLVLMPSEETGMIQELKDKKININKIHIDPRKMFSPISKIEAFLVQDQQLKEAAKRAFISYIKSVYLMKNKSVFKVKELDFDLFSKSLGLVSMPRIRFIDRLRFMSFKQNSTQNQTKEFVENINIRDSLNMVSEDSSKSSESSDDSDSKDESSGESGDRHNLNYESNHSLDFDLSSNSENEDELLKIKRRNHEIEQDSSLKIIELKTDTKSKVLTKAALARRVLKKKIVTNKKVLFNDEGQEVKKNQRELQSELGKKYMDKINDGIDIELAKKVLKEEDKFDRKRHQDLIKSRKNKTKLKPTQFKDNENFDYESDSDIDLSWLPDPDKVYNNERDNCNDENKVDSPFSKLLVRNKRKKEFERISINTVIKRNKIFTLNEAEDIAMKLLQ